MLTELRGKAGRVCEQARSGELRCPLIVRPTSEDVITGHLFQVLGAINPRWWVPDLLNYALGTPRFRRQHFRRFEVDLWNSRPYYPRHMIPWSEGRTEVDVTLRWENPATTVFIEMKFGSDVSAKTSGDDGTSGYPSDQIIRNIRVGLRECHWFDEDRLFDFPPRDFALVLLAPERGHRLVGEYRKPTAMRRSIPNAERLRGMPERPFLGELGYANVVSILRRNRSHVTRAERRLLDDLTEYLEFKLDQFRRDRPGQTGAE